MAIYGYCRISQKKQNIERQVRNILSVYPTAIIIREAFTGRKIEGRKEWEKIYRTVRSGDMIVFDSVSRFSRNAEEGFELYIFSHSLRPSIFLPVKASRMIIAVG